MTSFLHSERVRYSIVRIVPRATETRRRIGYIASTSELAINLGTAKGARPYDPAVVPFYALTG